MRFKMLLSAVLFSFPFTINAASLDFLTHEIGTGSTPVCVWPDDIDGDGDVDLIVANQGSNTVVTYLNNGHRPPAFSSVVVTGIDAVYLRTGDLDGDGDKDIAACSSSNNTIYWLENRGGTPPSFITRTLSTTTLRPASLALADINGDGKLDVATASANDNSLKWHKNNGGFPPTFTTYTISSAINFASGVAAGDLDKDGDIDLVCSAPLGHFVNAYYNSGGATPTFSSSQVMGGLGNRYPGDLAIADVNADGNNDVIVAETGPDSVYWYSNNGVAFSGFTESLAASGMDYVYNVFPYDVDKDGDKDIVSASLYDHSIHWIENQGGVAPVFTKHTISTTAMGARSAAAADLDGDGDIDLASCGDGDNKTRWYENAQLADLSITKTMDKSRVETGGLITATLTIANAGPKDATDIVAKDILPLNSCFLPELSDPLCQLQDNVITRPIASLAVGQSLHFAIAMTVENPLLVNQSSVSGNVADLNPDDNTSSATASVAIAYPHVKSIVLASPSCTNGDTAQFCINFTENVSGVDTSDFALHSTGTVTGTVQSVSPNDSATSFTVTVSNLMGDGSARVDLVDNDSIKNARMEPLSGPVDGSYDQAPGCCIDHTKPQSKATCAVGTMTGNDPVMYVLFAASDANTLQDVRLFYRRNNMNPYREITQTDLNGHFQFDTSTVVNGGDGSYDFYTVATDQAGNVEDAPAAPDITVHFSKSTGVDSWSAYK